MFVFSESQFGNDQNDHNDQNNQNDKNDQMTKIDQNDQNYQNYQKMNQHLGKWFWRKNRSIEARDDTRA